MLILSPFAPHLAEELWARLGHAEGVCLAAWPSWDEALCVDDVIELPIQVNGKVRGHVRLARDASEADAKQAALAAEGIAALVANKTIKKFVYVPARIVNLVVG